MNDQVHFKEKILQIKELANSATENASNEPHVLETLCSEIKSLSSQANSVPQMDFFMDTLEKATSFLDNQNSPNEYWKKNFTEMAGGLLCALRSENEFKWKKIEDCLSGIFPDSVSVTFLYNNVNTQGFDIIEEETNKSLVKKAKSRKCSQRTETDVAKPIKILSQTTSSSADSYRKKMQICLDRLNEVCGSDVNESVPFYNFAINCQSYAQTIYNIFILSFLVREHLAVMSVGENHELRISPSNQIVENRNDSLEESISALEDDNTFQLILSINPNEWKMLKKALGLKKSMLPNMCSQAEFSGHTADYPWFTNGVEMVE